MDTHTAVTYGWPGLPTTTKIVDLQREVKVGTQIMSTTNGGA